MTLPLALMTRVTNLVTAPRLQVLRDRAPSVQDAHMGHVWHTTAQVVLVLLVVPGYRVLG